MKQAMMKSEYDADSAIRFLLLGLGIGTFLTILFNPKTKHRVGPEGIKGWRTPGMQLQRVQSQEEAEETKERAA
jgi:hypothetical protein